VASKSGLKVMSLLSRIATPKKEAALTFGLRRFEVLQVNFTHHTALINSDLT